MTKNSEKIKTSMSSTYSKTNGGDQFKVLLFIIVFVEGASVMAVELAGVKMIAPFYGTTLYVWAAVLSVTLGGLALGYFLGGRVASKYSGIQSAPMVLLIGAFLVFIMPYTSKFMMNATSSLSIRTGPFFSSLFFILPPLVCMGMISPIIIQLGTKELNKAGKFAGTVYALSTVGGIIMTLLTGLYFLPEWGIQYSVLLVTALLGAIAIASYFLLKRVKVGGVAMMLLVAMILYSFSQKKKFGSDKVLLIEQSEGVLGQITVFDFLAQDNYVMRYMMINGIPQTYIARDFAPYSAWPYIHRISTIASYKPAGSRALLIGMAGGTIAMELKGMGFKTDVVEIDKRMPKLAERYFGFDKREMNITIDDGRHYLNTTEHFYDIVIIDVVNGEEQPFHLFTKQALAALKGKCNQDALVLINFQGYLDGIKGLPARSVMKTLAEVGFSLRHFFSGNETDEEGDATGDIHLIAVNGKIAFGEVDPGRLNRCCKAYGYLPADLFSTEKVDFSDGIVLNDDKPALEKMNVYWTELWRKRKLKDLTEQLSQHNYPIFQ